MVTTTRPATSNQSALHTAADINWAAAASTLRDDGVVHLGQVLGADAIATLATAFDTSLSSRGAGAVDFYPKDEARFFQDTGQNYLPLVRPTGLHGIVAALWGGEQAMWYMGEQLFLKDGGFSRRTPWHQDTSYLRMRGEQLVACWICLDPLPKSHCLEFVRGSHKTTLYNGSAFLPADDTAPLYEDSPLPRLPNIEADRQAWDIVSWDLVPGDVIVFHLGILHGGAGTEPGMRRRTASLRFIGPDVVYDARVRDNRNARRGNDQAMADFYANFKDGDPLHTAGFLPPV